MEWLKEHLKPTSLSQYMRIGSLLVYRKLWIFLLILLLLGIILLCGFPSNLFEGAGETQEVSGKIIDRDAAKANAPLFRWDAPDLLKMTGIVRLADEKGVIRYIGDVEQGVCTGFAEVFDEEGKPVYRGPVKDNQYEGEKGILFAPDGAVLYEGDFSKNLFHGEGRLADEETGVISEGRFAEGEFSSEGKQLLDGVLLREGSFLKGVLDGEGKEYDLDGELLREGAFTAGLLNGKGVEYGDSTIIFQESSPVESQLQQQGTLSEPDNSSSQGGSSAESQLQQEGTPSKPDGSSSQGASSVQSQPNNEKDKTNRHRIPLREGNFIGGLLDGIGRERSPNAKTQWVGAFSEGKLEGAGRAYTNDGNLLYEGAFHEGKYHGMGTLYSPDSGRIQYDGNFQNGVPFGQNQLYDAQGQLYYTGAVYKGGIDVFSFLRKSLEDLEASFQIHPLIYVYGEKTAFVYPAQGLAFLTDSLVRFVDSEAEDATADEEVSEPESIAEEEQIKSTYFPMAFSDENNPKEIILSTVLMVGKGFAGLPEEEAYREELEEIPTFPVYIEYFAADLLGIQPNAYQKERLGEFIYEFTDGKEPIACIRSIASKDGLLTMRYIVGDDVYYVSSKIGKEK